MARSASTTSWNQIADATALNVTIPPSASHNAMGIGWVDRVDAIDSFEWSRSPRFTANSRPT
jgi:hypothetical protein